MSYRREQTKKGRKAKTGERVRRMTVRDTRFCQRWGILEGDAWMYNRQPDASLTLGRIEAGL